MGCVARRLREAITGLLASRRRQEKAVVVSATVVLGPLVAIAVGPRLRRKALVVVVVALSMGPSAAKILRDVAYRLPRPAIPSLRGP